MRRNVDLLCAPFTMTRQDQTRESEVGKQRDILFGWSGSWIRVVIDGIYSTLWFNLSEIKVLFSFQNILRYNDQT